VNIFFSFVQQKPSEVKKDTFLFVKEKQERSRNPDGIEEVGQEDHFFFFENKELCRGI